MMANNVIDDHHEEEYDDIEMNNNNTKKTKKIVDIGVGGMTCSMCSSAIHKLLTGTEGITFVSVSLATNLARIEYDESSELTAEIIADEIECIGYDVNDIIHVNNTTTPDDTATTNTTKPAPVVLKKVELVVGGMTCSMCSASVTKALKGMPGVQSVDVSLSTNVATVHYYEYDNNNNNAPQPAGEPYNYPHDLEELVEDIGYDVNDVIVSATNAAVPSSSPTRQKYRDDDNNNFEEETQESVVDDNDEEENRLERILKQQDGQLRKRRNAFLWSAAGTVPILTINMIIPRMLDENHPVREFLNQTINFFGYTILMQAIIIWLLTTPVQFGSGYTFYKTSYHGIRRRVLGMDVLVAIGTTSSYVYAFLSMFSYEKGHDTEGYRFFETSAVLLTFVLLGKWMNAAAVRRTSQALTQLMKLQAKTAIKISVSDDDKSMKQWNPATDSYTEQIVPISHIHPNDTVKVLRGSNIPADGTVLHGELTVDQSMITGESIPVLKSPGDDVLGGTICSETSGGGDGAAFIKVTGVGADSALSQIVSMVQDAQSRQVPIQNYADTIASIFVPVVVVFSFVTFLTWYLCCVLNIVPTHWYHNTENIGGESPVAFSLLFGIAALVISCPCALGLATPTAVMVGTGVGARHGILMKGGETLEVSSKVNVVVFDKTGTLTKGKPAVTDFHRLQTITTTSGGISSSQDFLRELMNNNKDSSSSSRLPQNMDVDDYLVWLLGSLERNSEHILATAIVDYAESKLNEKNYNNLNEGFLPFVQPSDFVAVTGRGASGIIHDNVSVVIGNRAFIENQHDMKLSTEAEETVRRMELEGKTAIVAGINGVVCAVLGIADELKDDAKGTIRYLQQKLRVDVWMVTGDSCRTAYAIAKQLDLSSDRVVAEALPITKVEHVRKLQQTTHGRTNKNQIVCMVGDGINDSPALVEADVGVSMGTGSDIAAEASDMVLVGGTSISGTCTALDLSRTIFRRIQWNLVFSLVYNVIGIPIAAGVLFPIFHTRLPPTLAAVAMALSSISVVASSLALRLYRPPNINKYMSKTTTTKVSNNSNSSLLFQPKSHHRGVGGVVELPKLPFVRQQQQKYDQIGQDSDDDINTNNNNRVIGIIDDDDDDSSFRDELV